MNRTVSRFQRRLADGMLFQVRVMKRRMGGKPPIYFCLNSGRCGSASLVRLLQANRIRNCYHELAPDLHRVGINYYEHRLSTETVAEEIRRTRSGVFLEANNRLFSLTGPIRHAFPEAKFLFLHRNGRDVVRSGLQRQWYQEGDRFGQLRLGAHTIGSSFVKTCRYWADVNQRIDSDMRAFKCRYIALRFEDLVQGDGLQSLEDFLEIRLSRCAGFPSANQTTNWSVPAYEDWCELWQQQFDEICGPVMKRLGYETDNDTGRADQEASLVPTGQSTNHRQP